MTTADASRESILRLNDALHAFVDVDAESALRQSEAGSLCGWSIAIKDNFDIAGKIVGVGAPMFATRRATGSATAVQRLIAGGAQIVGRAQMVELAFGGWGINAALGSPRNPWDGYTRRVAGGSSSGAAVAVAARMTRAALGSDTAGSIRMPAALCGVTGLKTSFGLIPVDGVFPLAPSYDTVGPIARSASDCATLFEALTQSTLASTSATKRWRIRLLDPADYPVQLEPDVQQALDQARAVFERLGSPSSKRTPPFALADLTRDAGILISSEAWSIHQERFENEPQAFGLDVRRRLEQARTTDFAMVASARRLRTETSQRFQDWLQEDEVLLLPTVHCTAPPLDAVSDRIPPLGQFTRWVNHVGGCALSLPAGLDRRGLPTSIQLVGRAGTESLLLRLGCAFQEATNWHQIEPDLAWASAP
ncbi:amidase [Hydrogenophaga sp.]|uniref:amidase n=1 Tax=Hydrogenophaga sp. TaxID=1904254 RepID=UPI0035677124